MEHTYTSHNESNDMSALTKDRHTARTPMLNPAASKRHNRTTPAARTYTMYNHIKTRQPADS